MKKLIVLILIMCLLISMVGCGITSNPVVPSPETTEDEDLFLAKVVDSQSDIQFIAEKEDEVLAFLVEKDMQGNPIEIRGVAYLSDDDELLIIIAGENGLPKTIIDSKGNRIEFTNYTNLTAEVYWYDEQDELIQGPITIDIDEQDLLELEQIYFDFNSKSAKGKTNNIIRWGLLGIGGVICVGGLYFSGPNPPVLKVCSSVVLGAVTALTVNEIDDAASFTVGAVSCVVSYGGDLLSCASTLNDVAEMSEDHNQPPTIDNLIAESTYVETAETIEITCYVNDPDEIENFTFWWSSPDGGGFIALPYIYQANLPSWESNVPWKCSSTIIWTAPDSSGTYIINCTVIDKEGETDSDSISIKVFDVTEQYADISGNWSGQYSTNLISGEITYVSVIQDGADFNGEYYDSNDAEGYFTGEFTAQNQFVFTMTQTNTYCQGTFNGNGVIEGNQMTITFSGHNCMGDHSNGTGVLAQ